MEILQDFKSLVELYYIINSDIPLRGSSVDRREGYGDLYFVRCFDGRRV